MFYIATDLDRTLLPNGNQPYDNSMRLFTKIVKNEKLGLIFVTGRHLKLIEQAIRKYHTPHPDYAIAEVGTTIYKQEKGKFIEDKEWIKTVASLTKGWDLNAFKEMLSVIKDTRLQEEDKQNQFKLSYYIDNLEKSELIVKDVTRLIKPACPDATIVYSVDETHDIGLLDILPKHATKLTALEYLRKKLKLKRKQVIYCGDSGNDILPLTSRYRSILVRNAIKEVRNTVKNLCLEKDCTDLLYNAQGYKKLNGYYVSGIIEGLIKFGTIPEKYVEQLD
jgi:hypothetical protein